MSTNIQLFTVRAASLFNNKIMCRAFEYYTIIEFVLGITIKVIIDFIYSIKRGLVWAS